METVQETMSAIIKCSPEPGYEFRRVPVPKPQPNEVLLRIERAAICGTDILLYKWDPLTHWMLEKPMFVPGHECSGEVVGVGESVRNVRVGDRVCAETHIPCGHCYQCTHGSPHICRNLILFGHHVDGCFAEYTKIPSSAVYVLKSHLPAELACLLEPMGVSLRGVEEVGPRNDSLLITGCGPIGLFAIGLGKFFGARLIMASDISPTRLEVARRMGADVVINVRNFDLGKEVLQETAGDGVGCIIECSGEPTVVQQTFSVLRKGGKIVLLGNPKGPVEIVDVMRSLMHKELTLKTLHGRKMYETWERCESLLADGSVDIAPIHTHTFPLRRFDEAFAVILKGEACKVELVPGG